VKQTNSPPSVSRMSKQCGSLNISQHYKPPRPVTGIALLFKMKIMYYTGNTCGPPRPVTGIALLFLALLLMTNAVFWDVILCGSCKNRRFGGTYRLHHQDDKN
jgi:hypothetical protein